MLCCCCRARWDGCARFDGRTLDQTDNIYPKVGGGGERGSFRLLQVHTIENPEAFLQREDNSQLHSGRARTGRTDGDETEKHMMSTRSESLERELALRS